MKRKIVAIFMAALMLVAPFADAVFANDLPREWITSEGTFEDEIVNVVVQLKDGVNRDQVISRVKQLTKATVRNEYDLVFNGFSVAVSRSYVNMLKLMPQVKAVTKVETYYPTMASSKLLAQAEEAAAKYKNNGEGVVVSIIDSGMDTSHKDMQTLANPSRAKIKTPYAGEDNKDTTFTMKIPYGYNFSDKSYNVFGSQSNHGMHVGGIVGANGDDAQVAEKKAIDGVASQVQLLAMKVFSNNSDMKGAASDDIIAAIEASVEHGADIINMSLGSPAGAVSPQDPMQRAVNAAADKGVLLVISAGNEMTAFTKSANDTTVGNEFDRDDIGLVGSPSTAEKAISIASFENTNKFVSRLIYTNVDGKKVEAEYYPAQGNLVTENHKFVFVGYGGEGDYQKLNIERLDGKFALIERGGDLTFTQKVTAAKAHGAEGAVIFNNREGKMTGMSLAGAPTDIYVAGLNQNYGQEIKALIEKNPDAEITLLKQMVQVDNEVANNMSGFTSWGTTSNLDFKPELTGIGGNVYSTDNNNGYTMMSGTSMSAPFVSGASAIILSQLKQDLPGLDNYGFFAKKTMLNTAHIIINPALEGDIPYSPRRQGSGLIQTRTAIENRVLATMNDEHGDAVGALRSFSGKTTFTVNLKNYGTDVVSFDIDPGFVQTTINEGKAVKETKSSARIDASASKVTLTAGQSKTVSFTLDASSVTDDFVEGFVHFKSLTTAQPDIHFAYMGYAGDWNHESIIDAPDTVEAGSKNVVYGDSRLRSMIKKKFDFADNGSIIDLGVEVDTKKPSEKYVSFSPNDDGYADIVIPQFGLLRNASDVIISVLNKDHQEIRVLGMLENARRQSYSDFLSRVEKKSTFTVYPYVEGIWDGKVYDKTTGLNKIVDDGQYFIKVAARLSADQPYQETLFPVKVDRQKPQIKIVPQTDGKTYATTDDGRVITFEVTDNVGAYIVYGKVGNERIMAKKQSGNTYTITLPYNIEASEDLTIYANDYALNETSLKVPKIMGNSLQITNWKRVIDKKMNGMGEYLMGKTTNDSSATIQFRFVNAKDNSVVETKDYKLINKNISFAMFKLEQQGKYAATAIEKDAQGKVVKTTALGTVVYDYTAPTVTFNHVKVLTEKSEQLRPDPNGKYDKNYKEYVMQLNPDGTATYEGKIQDNVFDPKELTLTIGSRDNVVKVDAEGNFKYTLQTPSKHFDFMNVSQPSNNAVQTSSLIEGLDLAVDPTAPAAKRGKERTYTITKYVEATEQTQKPEFKLTTTSKFIVGAANLNPSAQTKIYQEGDKYFIDINGYTNDVESVVTIDGETPDVNPTAGGGSHFSKRVEITEGINTFNVRAHSKDGKLLADRKIRVLLDMNSPSLTLETPTTEQITTTTETTQDGHSVDINTIETYEDHLVFSGTIADAGFGYTLTINGDVVATRTTETAPGNSKYGDNTQHFEKRIDVADGDIITIFVEDMNGNTAFTKYLVKRVEKPLDKNVVLKESVDKKVGDTLTVEDVVISNPDNYDIELGDYSTAAPGSSTVKVKVIYDANNIDEHDVTLNVTANFEALEALKGEADKLEVSDFTPESVDAFKAAKAEAEAVLETPFATQERIDAAMKALNDAMNALELLPLVRHIENAAFDLSKLSEADQALLKDRQLTFRDIYFTRNDKRVKVDEAQLVELQVDDVKDLTVYHISEDGRLDKVEGVTVEGNTVRFSYSDFSIFTFATTPADSKAELKSLIDSALRVSPSLYTDGSTAALFKALSKAVEVNDDPQATPETISAATEALRTAMNALERTDTKAHPGSTGSTDPGNPAHPSDKGSASDPDSKATQGAQPEGRASADRSVKTELTPKTGDTFSVALSVSLILAAGAILATLHKRRGRN